MKKMLVEAVRMGFERLPLSARNACLETCADTRDPFTVIRDNADAAHVVNISIAGEYGIFEGSPRDLAVLRAYALTGHWARQTNELVKQFFDGGEAGTFIDIGANIGFTAVPAAGLAGVKVHAFEPDPANFKCLQRNVNANCPAADVTLYNVALFDRKSSMKFERSPDNYGDHRVRLNETVSHFDEHSWEAIEVDACRLDDISPEIIGPLAVKIDTQGAEPFVLSGAGRTLDQAQLALIEFAPYWLTRMGGDPTIVYDYVRQFDQVQIVSGESDEAAPVTSGKAAAEKMSQLLDSYDGKEIGSYWDVIARRM